MEKAVIAQLVLGAIVAILIYFLKVLHNDVRRNTQNVGKNHGRIDSVQVSILYEKEMRQVQYGAIKESLDKIEQLVKEKA